MVSRDTRVHLAVLALAFAGLAVVSQFAVFTSPLAVVGYLLYNGGVLAGAHLYLAWRGEDGLVPVAARWRFVAAVAVVLSLGGAAALSDPLAVGPVTTDAVLSGAALLVAVGYLVVEARAGYRESRNGA